MKKIWIDLDNSPHVPLFRPVIGELDRRGVESVITARDYAQTKNLLELWEIPHQLIGRHGGKNKFRKVQNLFERSGELRKHIKSMGVDLALSHGSRTQLVASRTLGIRSIVMMDYEYTESFIFNNFSNYILVPEYIPESRLASAGINTKKVLRYPGFKEQLYLRSFRPEPGFRSKLGISDDCILVTVRPPAMEGNYHDSMSEKILTRILNSISGSEEIYPLIIGRTDRDRRFLEENISGRLNFLEKAVDGLQLAWNSDVFISGGGTMNREAALLGVPTYSIFTGRKPYLDEYLQKQGRLTFIDDLEKLDALDFSKRVIGDSFKDENTGLIEKVVDIILSI